ncbi:MAG: DNA alkylation repair protein [Verrucomicrobia bacterium]|nr:DNA alkylation repair protein [Verrucomicrobiota bacterium]
MTLEAVLQELAARATPSTRCTYLRHGAPEPLFGVRIGDLKPLQRALKGRQELALELYATGNSDAMYLAGLIADGSKMTRAQLNQWAAGASWHMIAGTIVPWVASEHPAAMELAGRWIESRRELTAIAGWSTLTALTATRPDADLPMDRLESLLDRCRTTLHDAPNRVRYAMNNFVIGCGTYVAPLAERALDTARRIGPVTVDLGNTACQVPEAPSYILKCRRGAAVAPKRKTTRC